VFYLGVGSQLKKFMTQWLGNKRNHIFPRASLLQLKIFFLAVLNMT
jgi:hypothetical protein